MATITKTSTAATLNLAATNAWDLARVPNITPDSDIATWVSGSLGGAYTGAVTATGLSFGSGFATNSSFAGLVTIGSSGIAMTAGSTPVLTFSGGVDIGSSTQNWVLSGNPNASTAQMTISGATGLKGSGTINLSTVSPTPTYLASVYIPATANTFTGTINLGANVQMGPNSANALSSGATVNLNGSGVFLYNPATSGSTTTFPFSVNINADGAKIGNSSRTSYYGPTSSQKVTFSGSYGLTSDGSTYFAYMDVGAYNPTITILSGTYFGPTNTVTTSNNSAGFTTAGAGTLYVQNVTAFTGTLTVNGPAWFDYNGTIVTASATGQTGATNVLPNMTSLVINSGGDVFNYISNSGQVIVPWNVTVNSGGRLAGGVFNTSGTGYYDYTGTISGDGTLTVAAYGVYVNINSIVRIRTRSTPANLVLGTNGVSSTAQRTAKWEYAGTGDTFSTSIVLDQGVSVASYSFYTIENVGTGKYTTTGGIDLKTSGTSTLARVLTIAATNADFEIQGVVQDTDAGGLSISKTGANKLILSGNNTFIGTTTLTAGTLELGHANALAYSTLVLVSGGGSLALSSGISTVVLGNVTIPTGTSLSIPSGAEFRIGNKNVVTTQTGTITGSGKLTKIGTSTLTLSNASNSFGYFTLANGIVSFGAASHLGGASISIGESGSYNGSLSFTYSGATSLTLSNNFALYEGFTSSTTQDIALNGSFTLYENNLSPNVVLVASGNIAFNGSVVGSNAKFLYFNLASSKGVTLSADNSQLLSTITVTTGYLKPTNGGALGPSSVDKPIYVLDGSYIYFDTSLTINQPSRTVSINGVGSGNGALYFNTSSFTYNSKIVLGADSSVTSATSSSITLLSVDTVTYNATLTPATSSTISLTGALIGSGTFTKSGAGTVSLGTTSAFTGTISVTAGTLSVSASDAVGGTGASVSVSGGTLKTTVSTGTNLKTKDLTFSGGNLKIGA
jgi:autotransporter-associated beta strand protein